MRVLAMAVGALLAAAAPSSLALAAPAEHSLSSLDTGDYSAEALALAEQSMPEGPYTLMLRYMAIAGLREGLGDEASALEEQSPGIISEMAKAVDAAAAPFFVAIRAKSLRRYARLFSRELAAEDIAYMRSFYAKDAGRKLIEAKYAMMMSGEFASSVLENSALEADDILRLNRKTANSVVETMSEEELAQLEAFSRTATYPKMKALQPLIARIEAEESEEPAPELEEAISDAVRAVYERRKVNAPA